MNAFGQWNATGGFYSVDFDNKINLAGTIEPSSPYNVEAWRLSGNIDSGEVSFDIDGVMVVINTNVGGGEVSVSIDGVTKRVLATAGTTTAPLFYSIVATPTHFSAYIRNQNFQWLEFPVTGFRRSLPLYNIVTVDRSDPVPNTFSVTSNGGVFTLGWSDSSVIPGDPLTECSGSGIDTNCHSDFFMQMIRSDRSHLEAYTGLGPLSPFTDRAFPDMESTGYAPDRSGGNFPAIPNTITVLNGQMINQESSPQPTEPTSVELTHAIHTPQNDKCGQIGGGFGGWVDTANNGNWGVQMLNDIFDQFGAVSYGANGRHELEFPAPTQAERYPKPIYRVIFTIGMAVQQRCQEFGGFSPEQYSWSFGQLGISATAEIEPNDVDAGLIIEASGPGVLTLTNWPPTNPLNNCGDGAPPPDGEIISARWTIPAR
ncbi:MAG: hypothetical protein AAFX06_30225 [Planctomycetota bacterium]